MNKTIAVIFSYNRPLQVCLCLSSFKHSCKDFEDVDVKVLYKYDDERMKNAYAKVAEENPSVEFIREVSFHTNVNIAIINYKFTVFITDDTIFTRSFSIAEVIDTLGQEKVLGFSLRLGKNTNFCYPVSKDQAIPEFTAYKNVVLYDWTKGELDWNYPLELSSSVYRTWDILKIINSCLTINPNGFESAMDQLKVRFPEYPLMGCYEHSVAFASPINKIRKENSNRITCATGQSIENLLIKFEYGDRIDPFQFTNFETNAAHFEALLWL